MKNLKKTLAVVLAFAMILGMGAISTAAYTDVAEGTVVSEAVEILSNLDILTGFEDGTFRPSETVTRAQMAAIICRVLGYEDQAQSSMGTTVFADVAADHWASGYINVAQAQQIINGYGDGNYGPEDKVTYEQAVKMIVSALGYDLAAQSKGGYPTGYLAIASTKGITKNANGRVGDAAARSAIAVLVYNSLEVALMDQTSWSTGAAGDEYGMTEETILSKYLGVKKYEGVVSATPLTGLAEEGFDPEAKSYVGFESGLKVWKFDNKTYKLVSESLGTEGNAVNADLIEDADKYLGKKVVAYIGAENDAETGEKMVYAMAEKQGANATLKLNVSQLVAGLEGDEYDGKLVYKKAGSNKKYDVNLNISSSYVNYEEASVPTDTDAVIALFENDDEIVAGGTLELIDSDTTDAGYETIIVIAYDDEAVVEEVEVDDTDYFFSTYEGVLEDIDTESETELVVVYKDGEVVEPSVIAAGDVVSVVEIGEDARALYVSSKSVTGSVDGWDDEYVTIAGEEYAPSGLAADRGTTLTYLQDMEGIFYLNVDGQIAYADGSVAKGAYGVILNTGKDAGMGSKYYATILTADGEVKSYNYAKTVDFEGDVYSDAIVDNPETEENEAREEGFYKGTVSGDGAAISALIADLMDETDATHEEYTAGEAYAHVDTVGNLLYEIKIKNGEIKGLKAAKFAEPEAQSKYNASTTSLGSKTFDETSVMFALVEGVGENAIVEEDDIKVGKAIEMLADEGLYHVALPAAGLENGIYKLAVGYELATAIAVDSEIIIVTGTRTKSYNDDRATVITGFQAGNDVEVILYNEDGFEGTQPGDLEVGDIIVTGTVVDGVADTFEALVLDGALVAEDNESKELYYSLETAVGSDSNFIWFDAEITGFAEETGTFEDVEDLYYMVMQKSANCVMIDMTEDEEEPEVSKKTLAKSIIGNTSKYVSEVFVRVIDEQLIDVVVYKTNVE